MKTSKLLLLTIVGLILCIADVAVDTLGHDIIFQTEQLTSAAKSCFHKYFPESSASLAEGKYNIIDTANEEGISNSYEKELTAMGDKSTMQNSITPW